MLIYNNWGIDVFNVKNKKIMVVLITALLVLTLLTGCFPDDTDVSQPTDKGSLFIDIIDVGQGDSTFIRFPNNKTMLIDAATKSESSKVIDYIESRGVDKIDYLVATHPHEDHIGGMADIIKAFDIGDIYMPKVTHTSKTFKNMIYAIKDKGLKIKPAKGGSEIFRDDAISVDILAPNKGKYKGLNNYSVVVKITYQNTSFLFTGDAERISENEMLDAGYDLRANVLKVGHHGSNSSTTKKFLEAVSPEIAIISCGKDNKYNHPHKEVVNRLNKFGTKIYTTVNNGDISIESNGKDIIMR